MPEPIVARAHNVAQILSDEFRLVLPYFQRGYAWQEVHVARLLSDTLQRAAGGGEIDWYPLGTMVVSKRPDQPEAWVADGHQRLITLTILIAILRDLETDAALKSRLSACILGDGADGDLAYRLTTHEAARDCLRAAVQAPGGTALERPDDNEDRSESEANIIANRDYLRSELIGLAAERRQSLARFVLDRCFILVASVAEQQVARLLFSTMHDTGLKPSTVDLFKAQVLGRIAPDAREECQTIWERLEAGLGHSDFGALLHHIAVLEFRAVPREPVQTLLQARFDLDEAAAAQSFVRRRLRTIGGHFVEMRNVLSRPGTFSGPINRRLQYLEWVRNHDTWALPVLHWLACHGADDPRTEAFMRKVEALAWANTILADDPARRDQRYISLLGQIDDNQALQAGSALDIAGVDRRKMRVILAAPNFTNRRYRLFLLLRINAALDGDDAVRRVSDATLEHIFPARPAAGSRWQTDFNAKQALRYRNMLGNLTLLTETEQNLVRNHDFVDKRPVLAASDFALSRRLSDRATWGPKDIEQATADLIDIVMRSWGLD